MGLPDFRPVGLFAHELSEKIRRSMTGLGPQNGTQATLDPRGEVSDEPGGSRKSNSPQLLRPAQFAHGQCLVLRPAAQATATVHGDDRIGDEFRVMRFKFAKQELIVPREPEGHIEQSVFFEQ